MEIQKQQHENAKPQRCVYSERKLRRSLKYRPDIHKLILKLKLCLSKKNILIKKLKKQLLQTTNEKPEHTLKTCEVSTQTDKHEENGQQNNISTDNTKSNSNKESETKDSGWELNEADGQKSIADQVKEVAQSAMQESGMVYVESAGMYYDYKTGYYYNPELGLYYHTDTGCYYYYSEEKKSFVFHSYPDRSAEVPVQKEHKKSKKNKRDSKSDDIENLTKNLSQDEEPKQKRRKKDRKKEEIDENTDSKSDKEGVNENDEVVEKTELEDGECSESSESESDDDGNSTATASDDESVAKHHPPCMRIIVRETTLPKLKVGSLFLITKDGGTIGREGDHHAVVLRDQNVSRNHLDIKYDMNKQIYAAVDLGSKNGSVLNGVRMSQSQETSEPMEIVHGSTLQLGETKLLCHIHPGTDTCGHCEPGLIMETQEKEKVAYTRTCSVKKQHELELARLKNKYAPKLLEIDEISYKDRAQARRDKVGSSHHAEKTQSTDINTFIAPENKGFKLLEKMGWNKGEGLGKDNQGEREPIPLVSNEGKAGLGTVPVPETPIGNLGSATLRLAARTKMLRPPAKAFQNEPDEDSE
ncbi:angiogenic factor with G patch and FHA domains 1-like isoform X1 [Colias croceus]|uniref:angiogenic factor with G patch and FHA domains 1-like isoform X1 n=1 Tax=Colias crocea TaxID=72248 RepID=UPI001E27AFAD|nr:angiogenic factor with G patch and FHA domains 1-like isoform X1 [Colias croceus]